MYIQEIIEFLGTFAFAISGIRHAAAKNFDWFGGYVCGIAVAIGGDAGHHTILDDQSLLYALHRARIGACRHVCQMD